mgnify:CR=1 FL=1
MSLELVIGPMFSGKSTKLIRKIQLAKSINKIEFLLETPIKRNIPKMVKILKLC